MHIKIFFRVVYFPQERWGSQTCVEIEIDLRLFPYPGFGGDNNYSIGGPGAINSSSTCVLQHIDFFDIHGVDVGEIPVVNHTIEYDQWGVGCQERICPSDEDIGHIHASFRIGGERDIEPCQVVSQQVPNIGGKFLLLFRRIDLSYRTGQVSFSNTTVSHHHDFIQQLGIGKQNNIHIGLPADAHFLGLVSDVGNDQNSIFIDVLNYKSTLKIR